MKSSLLYPTLHLGLFFFFNSLLVPIQPFQEMRQISTQHPWVVVPLGSCGAPGRGPLSPLELLPELGLVTVVPPAC